MNFNMSDPLVVILGNVAPNRGWGGSHIPSTSRLLDRDIACAARVLPRALPRQSRNAFAVPVLVECKLMGTGGKDLQGFQKFDD